MQTQRIVLSALIKSVLPVGILAVLLVCVSISPAAESDSYSQDVEKMGEMTTIDCARCHHEIFMSIKNGQGAHRIECRECHETFHGFRRGMRYEDVLPTCTGCHETPHGESEQMTACKSCHAVPHAPLASLELKTLEPLCASCHADAGTRIASDRVDHGKLKCVLCHSDRHGYVPSCQECHGTPHSQEITEGFTGCLDCHGNPHDLSLATDDPDAGLKE